jgi:squalene-hopene/tetraprenyl-beta-curcumene cyclase
MKTASVEILSSLCLKAKMLISEHISISVESARFAEMLDEDLNSEQNQFYFCYASLFCPNESEELNRINIAGYLYYRYLLVVDQTNDNPGGGGDPLRNLMCSNYYIEESIRLLSQLFAAHPEFWKFWQMRKMEHLNAFITDKNFSLSMGVPEFEMLADQKSANGKVAIDALKILGLIEEKDYKALLLSHKFFSCGFQYYDDVLDMKEDLTNRQTNISFCRLRKLLTEEEWEQIASKPDKLVKLTYTRGIASDLLTESLRCFNDALEAASKTNCPAWIQTIALKKKEVAAVLANVNFYLESLRIRVKLSGIKREFFEPTSINFKDAIQRGLSFIKKEQELDGSWKDTPVNTWLSGYWTTGFVLHAIRDLPQDLLDLSVQERAKEYLLSRTTNLWPYIEGWIEDSDSSNFALLGLNRAWADVQQELKELLTYQLEDGGITTYIHKNNLLDYLDDPRIQHVNGWTKCHVCVSAGTLLLLARYPDRFLSERKRLIDYLLREMNAEGLWDSYWWTSSLYATALIIEASALLNDTALQLVAVNAIEVLLSRRNEQGLFSAPFHDTHHFYSALMLNALCSSPIYYQRFRQEIEQIACSLLNSQYADGSWDSSYALRIPPADCLNPDSVENWRKSDLGEGVVTEDIHRIITTSVMLGALNKYSTLTYGD